MQYLLALLNLPTGASQWSLTTSPGFIWQIPKGPDSFTVGHVTIQSNETEKGEPNLKVYGPVYALIPWASQRPSRQAPQDQAVPMSFPRWTTRPCQLRRTGTLCSSPDSHGRQKMLMVPR